MLPAHYTERANEWYQDIKSLAPRAWRKAQLREASSSISGSVSGFLRGEDAWTQAEGRSFALSFAMLTVFRQ